MRCSTQVDIRNTERRSTLRFFFIAITGAVRDTPLTFVRISVYRPVVDSVWTSVRPATEEL